MLAKNNRLRKAGDIMRVYARGRHVGARQIFLKVLNNRWDFSRVVVVVSRKVAKKAVTRNLIRRRLSGILEKLWQTLPGGYDIVISVREDVSGLPTAELESQLKGALRKAGILENNGAKSV